MRRVKKFLCIFMCIVMTFTFYGCSKENNEKSNMVIYAYNSIPILNWDPALENSNGIVVLTNIYETLLELDPSTGEYKKVLAEDYSVSEDGLEWTFKIRQGVKFHDGTDLNAEAVKFSIQRTIDSKMGYSYFWDGVSEIEVKDEYTVVFHLSKKIPLDTIASCGYAAYIYSPTALKENGDDWFAQGNEAGTGPYKLVSQEMGNQVVLGKFDEYWGGWEGNHVENVVIQKIPEASTRRQMIEAGEADFVTDLSAEDIEALEGKVDIIKESALTNILAFYNTEKEPFNNVKFRQAVSYAFPAEDVIQHTLGGNAKKTTGIIPFGMWGHSDNEDYYNYDINKAKTLLEESGMSNKEMTLLYTYCSGNEAQKICGELWKNELSKIGVNMELRAMPWESQWEMAKLTNPQNRQDIFVMMGFPTLVHPDCWLKGNIHSSDIINFNLSYYENKQVDEMIEKAYEMSANDLEGAERLIGEIQEILENDIPVLPLYDQEMVWLVNKDIEGFEYNPAYAYSIDFYKVFKN